MDLERTSYIQYPGETVVEKDTDDDKDKLEIPAAQFIVIF